LANYPTLGLAPVAEFAKAADASPATVLRFVAQIAFESYPDFQRQLRDELEERMKSPLQKGPPPARKGGDPDFLAHFAAQLSANMANTAARLPASEFEAVCARLADPRAACHLLGGRFTDAIAAYMTAHLRIVRPGVRKLDERAASRADQVLDVAAGDVAIILDIRRYDQNLLSMAKVIKARRASIILITDSWISPVSRYAKYVLPCSVDMGRTWDSSATLLMVAEAILARVTELSWDKASARIGAIEHLQRDPD